jgi:imidazolonepropionase-like amidohydrolase
MIGCNAPPPHTIRVDGQPGGCRTSELEPIELCGLTNRLAGSTMTSPECQIGLRHRRSMGESGSLHGHCGELVVLTGGVAMQSAQGWTLISNGQVLEGTGRAPIIDGAVLLQQGQIAYVGPRAGLPELPADVRRIDAHGGTIMPGLVEAHFHPTYFNVAALEDLDIKYPVEYVTLLAAHNAKLALECGYTSARSGGSLFNIDVWLKRAIEADVCPGPRLVASGREICGVGGLMDWNPDFRKIGMDGLVLLINGPDEARAAVRKLVKDGVEWVKTYPTGDAAAPDTNDHHTLCMTFEEMHAVVATAHNHGLKVTGHCRATEGIKNALRAGYDAIEHGTFMDDEAMELLLERDVPCVPALYFEYASVQRGPEFGLPPAVIQGHQETLEGGAESAKRILRAGGRLGMGGDYGFAWNPHGDYARELTFFVNYVGLTPTEVLTCATKTGAEIMGRGDELGTLEVGKLGDVLVVDGDVLANIAVLEDRSRFIAVVQNGLIKAGRLAQPMGV